LLIHRKNQTYFSFFALDIEEVSICVPIEGITWSIEKKEGFSASDRCLDKEFPLFKNEGAFLAFKGSDIAVIDSVEVEHREGERH
jgi:hypothetical protein